MRNSMPTLAALLLVIFLIVTPFAAWVTHIVVSIQQEAWFLLLAGAILFPVGIIHGIGVWFGLF